MVTCEVCVEGVPGAIAAEAGGAHRIELCAGLVEGGTTPSIGTVRTVLECVTIPTVVLVRPRGGDFLYSTEELAALVRDVEAIREAGAYGIATGLLTKEGTVDVPAMERIMESAGPLRVTFHRAFDMTRDPLESMEKLVALGVSRILTSGQERSAFEGLPLIRELVQFAGDRISILPGGGIGEGKVQRLVRETGVTELHFTAFSSLNSAMTYRNTRPLMGGDRVPGEFERLVTDSKRVQRIREEANAPS